MSNINKIDAIDVEAVVKQVLGTASGLAGIYGGSRPLV